MKKKELTENNRSKKNKIIRIDSDKNGVKSTVVDVLFLITGRHRRGREEAEQDLLVFWYICGGAWEDASPTVPAASQHCSGDLEVSSTVLECFGSFCNFQIV